MPPPLDAISSRRHTDLFYARRRAPSVLMPRSDFGFVSPPRAVPELFCAAQRAPFIIFHAPRRRCRVYMSFYAAMSYFRDAMAPCFEAPRHFHADAAMITRAMPLFAPLILIFSPLFYIATLICRAAFSVARYRRAMFTWRYDAAILRRDADAAFEVLPDCRRRDLCAHYATLSLMSPFERHMMLFFFATLLMPCLFLRYAATLVSLCLREKDYDADLSLMPFVCYARHDGTMLLE